MLLLLCLNKLNFSGFDKLFLLAFHDSAFQNAEKFKSQGGYVTLVAVPVHKNQVNLDETYDLTGPEDIETQYFQVALLSWRSYKSNRVVRSILGAETVSALTCFDASFTLKQTFCESFPKKRSRTLHVQRCEKLLRRTANISGNNRETTSSRSRSAPRSIAKQGNK